MIAWWFDKQISKAAIAFPSYSGKSSMMLFGPKNSFQILAIQENVDKEYFIVTAV